MARLRTILLAALVGWLGTLLVVRAWTKPLWHDEIYTILLAKLPLATFWRASLDGVDFAPPLNTILTHAVFRVVAVSPLSARAVPIAAFLLAAVCVFVVVGRRTNALTAALAVGLLYASPAWGYAVEARGYALSAAAFAVALYAWSQAADGRRATWHWSLMACALAAGVWAHFFAALMWLPIAGAEFTRQARHGFSRTPWIAFGAAGAALVPLLPIVSATAGHRGTFWARGPGASLAEAYNYVAGDWLAWRKTLALIGVVLVIELVRRWRAREWPRQLDAPTIVAAVICLAIPAITDLLGRATGVFTLRYLVFASVAIAFAVPQLVWWLAPRRRVAELIALVIVLTPLVSATIHVIREPPAVVRPLDDRPVLTDWSQSGKPFVMNGGVDFLTIWYDLPPGGRRRVVYLADPAGQLAIEGTDTVDRGYLTLAKWTPLPVVPFEEFVRDRETFWMYSTTQGGWTGDRLDAMNARFVMRAREPNGKGVLYEVFLR